MKQGDGDRLGFSFLRGISYEMVDAVTAIMAKKVDGETTSLKELTKTLQEMSSAERNSLLACLLYPSNVEAVAASPKVNAVNMQNFLNLQYRLPSRLVKNFLMLFRFWVKGS